LQQTWYAAPFLSSVTGSLASNVPRESGLGWDTQRRTHRGRVATVGCSDTRTPGHRKPFSRLSPRTQCTRFQVAFAGGQRQWNMKKLPKEVYKTWISLLYFKSLCRAFGSCYVKSMLVPTNH
jgi:hypothetical protein